MEPRKKRKPFNLLAWFAMLSFICIALISTISSLLLSRFITDYILHRDAVVTKEFIQSLAEAEYADLYFDGKISENTKTTFEDIFKRISMIPEVVRVIVYDIKGTVLWSDDERFIEHNFMPNPELIVALSGSMATSSGTSGKPSKAEHVFDKEVPFFFEIYIPIWNKNKNDVLGAFEVYKEPLTLFNAIKQGNRLVWVMAVLGGFFLYAALYWIVRRATFVMHQQQTQLIQSETMAAVGEMASAVAHGIRNPMASIRSSAELALEEDTYPLFRSASRNVILEVDRVTGWVKELLTYAQVSGEGFTSIQINELIRSTMTAFNQRMEKNKIKVSVDLEEHVPKINADEISLRHIFIGLITNAIEAMPEGGEIVVTNRYMENDGLIEINIVDTGKGIAKDQISKVFNPFFTTKRKGVGVGLSLVKRIIDRYNGTIRLDSIEGQGTTISLHIPITK